MSAGAGGTTPPPEIPAGEVSFAFVRSPGPGGQNVNKLATACELRFHVASSTLLDSAGKERLRRLAGRRLTRDDEIVIEAHRLRTYDRLISQQVTCQAPEPVPVPQTVVRQTTR